MDRPNLQGRVPDTITTRIPGGVSDGSGDATGGSSDDDSAPDAAGSDSRRLTTLLTLSGLGLTALGVVLRYTLDRRGGDESDDGDDYDRPDFDRGREGSVEIVGDTGAIDVAEDAPSEASTGGSETTADESRTTVEEGDDAADTESAESGADFGTEAGADVSVETFEADRADDDDDGAIGGGDAAAEREGPPRIAPLVGMITLVGIRLFVERVRKQYGEGSEEAAAQL